MFEGYEFKVTNPITKEVLKQEVWPNWISETEALKGSQEPRATYYKCSNEDCLDRWHPFTVYINGVEYLSSDVMDIIVGELTK